MSAEDPPGGADNAPDGDPADPFAGLKDALGGLFGGGLAEGLSGLSDVSAGAGLRGQATSDPARQIAMAAASEGASEPNVDPVVRMEYEALLRVAELQVAERTGLSVARSGRLVVLPVTRTVWAAKSVDAYRPYLARLSEFPNDLGDRFTDGDLEVDGLDPDDPGGEHTLSWISSLLESMAPIVAAVTTGTMVGRLAQRSLGSYDLPIPRPVDGPEADTLLVVAPNVEAFSADWSLPAEDLRLWICLHEAAHHAILGVPHVRKAIGDLLSRHAGAFRNDPADLGHQLGDLGIDIGDLSSGDAGMNAEMLAQLQDGLDPETVLDAVRSPEQEALLPQLEALVAVVVGVVDHVMDDIGSGLIGSYRQVTEALRRRRVTISEADRFVEKILGLNLTQEQVDRGSAFVAGVVEREGDQSLAQLWQTARNLPTPAEVDAPGLWLARLEITE